MKTYIVVKFQFEGVHRWPDAPDPVKYLRNIHRHMFYVTATIEVRHNDRELEFIMVKNALKQHVEDVKETWPGAISCESMAEDIIRFIQTIYGQNRWVSVKISEDDENGALVITD